MFKLEFDAANKPLAAAIGAALTAYGTGAEFTAELTSTVVTETTTVGDATHEVKTETTEPAGNVQDTARTATEQSTTTQTATSAAADGSAAASADPANLDEKGVAFNPDLCGKAAKPFYGSGKTKGQWKKRQGVDQTEYDAWYAAELAKVDGGNTSPAQETPVDTGAAFGGNPQTAAPERKTFTDAGQFMGWIAEQQTAGLLTQHDIDSAYQMTNVAVQNLFNPAEAEGAIAQVYDFLANIVEGQ